MKADTLAIIDGNNQTQWTRDASAPLEQAAAALRTLQAETGDKLHLIRSFTNAEGQEVLVEYLTDAADYAKPGATYVTVEVWHRNPPDFFYQEGQPVDAQAYVPVAHFTWPTQQLDRRTHEWYTAEPADFLDQSYAASQNIDSAWNPSKPCRSTSVGDVLVLRRDGQRLAYAVASVGFSPVAFEPTVAGV